MPLSFMASTMAEIFSWLGQPQVVQYSLKTIGRSLSICGPASTVLRPASVNLCIKSVKAGSSAFSNPAFSGIYATDTRASGVSKD